MSPSTASALTNASKEAATAAPVNTDVPICLDFLKGRCTRSKCRFLHPDLSQYQQLSGAVQAQAGRRVCEVWAMTGQCKFGAKCSRLHPSVVLGPQTHQPVVTLLLPIAVVPQPLLAAPADAVAAAGPAPCAPALPPLPTPSAPTAFGTLGTSPQVSFRSPVAAPLSHPSFCPAPSLAAPAHSSPAPQQRISTAAPLGGVLPQSQLFSSASAPAVAPRRPQHVVPPAAAQPEEGFQDLVQAILMVLDTEKDEQSPTDMPLSLWQTPEPHKPAKRCSQNPQHDWDRTFLDMLRNLHNAGR